MSSQRIEDVMDFPCEFTFRVIADSNDAIRIICEAAVSEITARAPLQTMSQPSRKGNFCVYRIQTVVTSADQIRAVYAALVKIEGVRTLL